MEKITIANGKSDELITGFKKMKSVGFAFLILGLTWIIPMILFISGAFGDNVSSTYYAPYTAGFAGVGIIFISLGENGIKKLKNNDFQAYKTKCIRKKFFNEYAVVENNEILSKKVSKPTKALTIIGSHKSINEDDEVGILHVDKKTFYAFALDT